MDPTFNELEKWYTEGDDIYKLHADFVLSLNHDEYEQDYEYYDVTNECTVVEIFDVCFVLKYEKNQFILSENIPPPTKGDEKERGEIFNAIGRKMKYFNESLESRRVAVTPHYQNDPELPACMSFLQFIVRKDDGLSYDAYDLFCRVVQRSQHIDNFLYDNQTVMKTMQLVIDYLEQECKIIVNSGTIFYDITSLHKTIKN